MIYKQNRGYDNVKEYATKNTSVRKRSIRIVNKSIRQQNKKLIIEMEKLVDEYDA